MACSAEWNVEADPRLMLVEDEEMLGQALTQWLQDSNVRVVWTRSAEEALQVLGDVVFIGSAFDGLLLNSDLPDAMGNRVIHEFRHEFPWAPVALMMGKADISTSVWAKARQIQILNKPVRTGDLRIWMKHIGVLTEEMANT